MNSMQNLVGYINNLTKKSSSLLKYFLTLIKDIIKRNFFLLLKYLYFFVCVFTIMILVPSYIYLELNNSNNRLIKAKNIEFSKAIDFDYKLKKIYKSHSISLKKSTNMNIMLKDNKNIVIGMSIAYDENNVDLDEEIKLRHSQILNSTYGLLSNKSSYDVDSSYKREYILKNELKNEFNSFLENGKVEEVYIYYFRFY